MLATVCALPAVAAIVLVLIAASRSRLSAPEPTLLVRDRHGRFLAELETSPGAGSGFGYWPAALPPRVAAATLTLEDRRFWVHPGVDPLAAARALGQNLRHGRRVSGASTIAMQLARLQRPAPRTLAHKLEEALRALFLTARNGRAAVLAHYLRLAPYGNRAHGIAYAARLYLDKPVADLSWAETAFLTAIPQAPGRMNPYLPAGRARAAARAGRILTALHDQGWMTAAELSLAQRELLQLRVQAEGRRSEGAMHATLRLAELARDPGRRAALGPGPLVQVGLDLDLQDEVGWMTYSAVSSWRARGAGNAAVIVADADTATIRAWIGSTDWRDVEHKGAIDYARAPRSSGSTLKPFLYAHALDQGSLRPADVLDDLGPGPGGIANADDRFLGPCLPRLALGNSRNVPAAAVLERAGLESSYQLLGDLGLHDRSLPASNYGLVLAVGGLPVTLEDLVEAYGALAGGGRLRPLAWVEPGRAGAPPAVPGRRVLSEDAARLVTLFLADPMARLPSFPRLGATELPFPVAVKTGTASDYRDAWTVAYSRRYLVGVWVGHPDWRPMAGLGGYDSAARLARSVLLHLHRDELAAGAPFAEFPPPRGAVPRRLCALTGRRATAACDRVVTEWLRPGEEPVDDCAAHVQAAIDTRNGLLATAATPRAVVEVRTFTELKPRYAAWAAAAGLRPRPEAAIAAHGAALDPQEQGTARPPYPRPERGTVRPPYPRPAFASPARGRSGPAAAGEAAVRLRLRSPEDGTRLLIDPETPPDLATIALEVVVDPPPPEVVWYVDGRPFEVAAYPFTARWPLTPGDHTFEARLPFAPGRSQRARVRVE